MSVNMSHNRDLFADTLLNQKRDTQMAPLCTPLITSQQCLFLIGTKITEHVWLNLPANESEEMSVCYIRIVELTVPTYICSNDMLVSE